MRLSPPTHRFMMSFILLSILCGHRVIPFSQDPNCMALSLDWFHGTKTENLEGKLLKIILKTNGNRGFLLECCHRQRLH